jgi:hypothetical protein
VRLFLSSVSFKNEIRMRQDRYVCVNMPLCPSKSFISLEVLAVFKFSLNRE